MNRNVSRRAKATLTREPLGANLLKNSTDYQLGFSTWLYGQHFWNFAVLVFPPQKTFYSVPLLPSPFISDPDHFWQVIQQYQPLLWQSPSPQWCAFNLLQHSHKHPAQTARAELFKETLNICNSARVQELQKHSISAAWDSRNKWREVNCDKTNVMFSLVSLKELCSEFIFPSGTWCWSSLKCHSAQTTALFLFSDFPLCAQAVKHLQPNKATDEHP